MSLTNQQVIDKALTKGGVLEEGASASTTNTADALSVLNQMMTMWRETDKDLNWFPQTDATEVCPIPDFAELAVVSQLAVQCSTVLRYPVTQSMYDEAVESVNGMTMVLMNLKLDNTDMTHLPWSLTRYWNITTDGY